jgi:tetratricopeptide (TPR) repeat protein
MSCPVFVGRQAELAALIAGFHESVERVSTRVVLVHGEAGIGKTRLVEELWRRVPCAKLRAVCSEPGGSLPFGAVTDLLRVRGHDLEPAAPSRTGLGSALERASAKAQHHKALVGALAAAFATEREAPKLLVVEDLHWADDATLEWIPQLVGNALGPLLLVLTFREERPGLALSMCLTEIERLRAATDVLVGPMPRADVLRLVELIPGTASIVSEEIADLADGNPLFVEELVNLLPRGRGGWDRSSALPRVVQLTFRQRSSALGDEARDLMLTAAALGREFSAEHLALLRSESAGEMPAALDELSAAGLVVEQEPGWFAFRHALIRSAAYESMPSSRRAVVHRRIGAAMEAGLAGRPELRAAELLHHWYLAADADRVAVWAAVACERALMANCPTDACAHASRAIDMLVRLRGEALHDLLRRRGEAYSWLGQFEHARADHESALSVARAHDDQRQQWRSLVDLGALAIEEDYGRAGDLFDEALELARVLDNDRGLAETLGWVGFWHMMGGDPAVALACQAEALTLLEALGDEWAAGELLDRLGWTSYVRADLPASRDAYRRGIGLNRSVGAPQALASCLTGYATRGADCFQLDSVWCDGEPLAWAADGRAAIEHARFIGWRSGEARALIWLGLHLAALGEHPHAFRCAEGGLAIAVEDRQVRFESTAHILYAALWLDLLDVDAALEHGQRGLRLALQMRSATVAATAAASLARAQVAAGRLDAAAATLDAIDPVARNSMPDRLVASAGVELHLARGEPADALRLVDALETSAPHAGGGRVIPRLRHLRGVALHGLGYSEDADACLVEAAGAARRLGNARSCGERSSRRGTRRRSVARATWRATATDRRCASSASSGQRWMTRLSAPHSWRPRRATSLRCCSPGGRHRS